MGLSGGQLLRRVELPLAVPYLAAGLRTAAVQVVATAALAAFVNGGGLGKIIRRRLRARHRGRRRRRSSPAGSLVAVLALLVEAVLALVERRGHTRAAAACRGGRPTGAAADAAAGN